MSLLTYPATWHLNAGFEPIRTKNSAHPSLVPFQAFEATDGWLIVGCAKEKFWDRLVVAIDRPDLGADPRFTNFSLRGKNQDVLLPILEEVFATNTVEHWLSKLGPAGVPTGPINDVEHALTEPHTLARNLVVETEHPVYNTVRQVASPVNFGSEAKQYRRAPQRNEHFDDIVRDQLGYDDERIAKLKAEGAFGTAKDEVRA